MQTAGGGFAAAVTAQDQLVDYKMTIGFPVSVPSYYQDVTKCVVSVSLNRAVTTQLPDGTTLISGYPSSAMTVVLAGLLPQAAGVPLVESDNIYKLMNPNDSTSAMWRVTRGGLPITWQAGLWDGASTADLVTQYTGTIDQVTCSNGVVTLVCRDQRSTVTNQATLPPVITAPPYNSGLTSEYAIDYLLRHSSPIRYYSWPAHRVGCVFAASFRSSIWAEVGSYDSISFYPISPLFVAGKFGSALNSSWTSAVYDTTGPIGDDLFFECWMSMGGGVEVDDNLLNDSSLDFTWDSGSGVFSFDCLAGGGSGSATLWSPGPITGVHYVAVQIHWPIGSTAITGTIRLDGTSHTFSTSCSKARVNPFTRVQVGGPSIEAVQLTTEGSGAPWNDTFSPTLIIDPSLNPLTALPDVNGQDTWTVLQDIAAAEAGVIGFDELGVCRFVNRNTIKTMTAVRSVTSAASLMSLDSLEQMSLCATHIQVPVNQVSIGALQNVWFASSIITVQPNNSTSFLATSTSPVVNTSTTDSGYWDGGPVGNTWRACSDPQGQGPAIRTGISLQVTQLSATSFSVTIVNSTPYIIYMVQPVEDATTTYPAGTPFIAIVGQPVQSVGNAVAANGSTGTAGQVAADAQWPPVASGGAVSNQTFGEVLLAVAANDWLQDLGAGQSLADDLLRDLFYPKPQYRNVSIVADPRLQLLDRVTLLDPDVSKISDDALIVGISARFSAGGWVQTIDARAVNRPGAWLLGVVGRSELGITTFVY